MKNVVLLLVLCGFVLAGCDGDKPAPVSVAQADEKEEPARPAPAKYKRMDLKPLTAADLAKFRRNGGK